MKYVQHALQALKNKKFRITKSRAAVITIFDQSNQPLNAYQVAELAKGQKIKIDTSTIYRIIEVLEKNHLVHFVKESQGYIKCQKTTCSKKQHCHHQFICENCHQVTELHFEDHNFIQSLQKQFEKLSITNHYLELSGLCQSCN